MKEKRNYVGYILETVDGLWILDDPNDTAKSTGNIGWLEANLEFNPNLENSVFGVHDYVIRKVFTKTKFLARQWNVFHWENDAESVDIVLIKGFDKEADGYPISPNKLHDVMTMGLHIVIHDIGGGDKGFFYLHDHYVEA